MKPDEHLEIMLKRRAESSAPGGGELCGDPELLAAYAENTLDAASREMFQSHLAICNACREAVVRLVRMAPREVVVAPAQASKWWRLVWATPVLATLGVVLMLRQSPQPQPAVSVSPAPTIVAEVAGPLLR